MTQLPYLCLYIARLETGDVGGRFGNIVKVNFAQPIVVKFPQREGKVIVTDKEKAGWM